MLEGREFKEKEKITSKVILEFMRHGEKEKAPVKSDEELRLTPKARKEAVTKGEEERFDIG